MPVVRASTATINLDVRVLFRSTVSPSMSLVLIKGLKIRLLPGIGPYRLVEQLGEGGMGVVHLALAPSGRAVADGQLLAAQWLRARR